MALSSAYRNLDLGVAGQVVKASPGQITGYYIANNAAAAARFVKFYNKATAPTQADTPVFTYEIPQASKIERSIPLDTLVNFSAGISLRATTGVADSDTGAPSTNDVVVNLEYR